MVLEDQKADQSTGGTQSQVSVLRGTIENTETPIQKVSVERRTDDQLCRHFQEFGDCSITWQQPEKGEENRPPAKTIAIVVDVPENKGAIRVYNKGSRGDSTLIGTVGTEHAGQMVIIPWAEHSWWFRLSGSLMVGYIVTEG